MDEALNLLRDNESVPGRLATTAAVLVVAIGVSWLLGRVLVSRTDDPQSRYYARKAARYATAILAAIILSVIWRAFAGRVGIVLGLAAAGVAFAMQEVIGAIAGWFNILSGRIFRVGDRIQMGGVRGDVIDITPLRTKVMEIGSPAEDESWVRGRQFTGRIVAISNKATFTEPVFNYSTAFDYLWEELVMPVSFRSDWSLATTIMEEEARRASSTRDAEAAIRAMRQRYPVPHTEVEPRVFTVATDDYLELVARVMVPLRTARQVKDELTRRIASRFEDEGIEVASTTSDVRITDRSGGRDA
ncbi:mechanosensitive ion channel family protein [Aquihabitans daechungensis]|uniref:mechanosensitive ion channel family protein n=1 Tax=Aquihabitans daechungensis TaxID=1052257 RepID=UPI003B9E9783